MTPSELPVIAEGDLATGEHWIVRAGGYRADFGTFLETIYPDGHCDQGGMSGPLLAPGSLMNIYTGGSDRGLRRLLVRTHPRVARVRVRLTGSAQIELEPLATDPGIGASFFARLLPGTAGLASVTALDVDGQPIETQELSRHEAAWRDFLRRSAGQES